MASASIAADASAPESSRRDAWQAAKEMAPARSIAFTGGKGGVGKSNVAVNVALELAALKRRVTLLDADFALANADVLLGLNPRYHLGHLFCGQRRLDEIVVEVSRGVRLIPGGSGVEELANLSLDRNSRLIAELRAMEQTADFMLIDTAAGISSNVLGVLRAASEVIVVTTPDPTSIVDAYATMKVLLSHDPHAHISLIINDAVAVGDAEQTYSQIRSAALTFLNHNVKFIGTVPHDQMLAEAVRERVPVVEHAPQSPASRAIRMIARQLDQMPRERERQSPQSFWENLTS